MRARDILPWALVALLAVPAIGAPFFNDDILHRLTLAGRIEGYRREWYELYDFVRPEEVPTLRDHGYLPWWASDDLKLRFFRPLSSALVSLDARVFGASAWAAHLHSLAWLLVLLAGARSVLRATLPAVTAERGFLLYAVAACHAVPLVWLAARHTLVASALSVWAWRAHVRSEARVPWGGLALLALASLGSELWISGAGAIVGYELSTPRRSHTERAWRLGPILGLVLLYVILYRVGGYGTSGSALYVAPWSPGGSWVNALRDRFPVLAAEDVWSLPSLASTIPQLHGFVYAAGVAAVAVVALGGAWAFRSAAATDGEALDLRWALSAWGLSLLPVVGGIPGGRLLLVAHVPFAFVLAITWSKLRAQRGRVLGPLGAVACGSLLVIHLALAPLVRVGLTSALARVAAATREAGAESDFGCHEVALLPLAPNLETPVFVMGAAMLLGRSVPRSLITLSIAPQEHRLRVLDDRTLEVETEGSRMRSAMEGLYRDSPLAVGDRVSLAHLTVDVLAVQRGLPVRIRAASTEPLDGDAACLLSWTGSRIEPLRALGPDGTTVLHPRPPPGAE